MPAMTFKDNRTVVLAFHKLDLFPQVITRIIDIGFQSLKASRILFSKRAHSERTRFAVPIEPGTVFILMLT